MPIRHVCACGNELSRKETTGSSCTIIDRPCTCAVPGGAKIKAVAADTPPWVTEKQVKERRALGLPVTTDAERYVYGRWT